MSFLLKIKFGLGALLDVSAMPGERLHGFLDRGQNIGNVRPWGLLVEVENLCGGRIHHGMQAQDVLGGHTAPGGMSISSRPELAASQRVTGPMPQAVS